MLDAFTTANPAPGLGQGALDAVAMRAPGRTRCINAENPDGGKGRADEIDFRHCLDVQRPYLGPVVGVYTDWTPLKDRPGLFPEDIDTTDPWQFRNVLVRD